MSKMICLECGNLFDEDEIVSWQEDRGECWGASCSETVCGSPCCEGDFTEARRCDCCNEWIEGQYIKLDCGDRICEGCYTVHDAIDDV